MPDSAPPIQNRIVGHGEEAPDQLLANPLNFRRHPGAQLEALRGSLRSLGYVKSVLVNRVTGHVLDGHARVEDALAHGQPTVPVTYVELTEEEERLALAVLDPLTGMAYHDDAALQALLQSITEHDPALDELLGHLSASVSVEPPEFLGDPDDVPDAPPVAITQLGDLIMLGKHRLLCGDARDADAWETLLGGEVVGMVWTDPPYGVRHSGGSKDPRSNTYRSGGTIENDDLDPAALERFLRDVLTLALANCRVGGAWYVAAPAGPLQLHFAIVLTEMKVWRQLLTWMKDSFVFGRSDYHYRHELLFYEWKAGAAHTWNGGRSQDSILEFPRPRASKEHPTMKPVALVARCIENSSTIADIVLDPFGGSGTTLIAAEQMGRAARLMELSPAYCDVIVARWERITGLTATRPGVEKSTGGK